MLLEFHGLQTCVLNASNSGVGLAILLELKFVIMFVKMLLFNQGPIILYRILKSDKSLAE